MCLVGKAKKTRKRRQDCPKTIIETRTASNNKQIRPSDGTAILLYTGDGYWRGRRRRERSGKQAKRRTTEEQEVVSQKKGQKIKDKSPKQPVLLRTPTKTVLDAVSLHGHLDVRRHHNASGFVAVVGEDLFCALGAAQGVAVAAVLAAARRGIG